MKCPKCKDYLIIISELAEACQYAFEALCTGDQQAEDRAIGAIEDVQKKLPIEAVESELKRMNIDIQPAWRRIKEALKKAEVEQ